MADHTLIEWTDATCRVSMSYGKQDWRYEGRGEEMRCLSGGIHRQSRSRGKMVHSLQGVAPSIRVRQRHEPSRWLDRPMHGVSKREGQIFVSAKAETGCWQSPFCSRPVRRQGAGKASRELSAPDGGNPRPKYHTMRRLRAPRIGGAA